MTAVVSSLQFHSVRVSARTTWQFAEVRAGEAVGFGECSDVALSSDPAAGYANLIGVPVDEAVVDVGARTGSPDLAERTIAGAVLCALDDVRRQIDRPSASPWSAARAVPLYANINRATPRRTPDGFAQTAADAVAAGFDRVKLAPFDGLTGADRAREGLACIQAVRDRVGSDVGVMVDVHTLLEDAELDSILAALAELDLFWLEDAAPVHRVDRLGAIREAIDTRIAGGELLGDFDVARPAIESKVLDVLIPDVKHAGGPANAQHIGRRAHDLGAGVSLHNPSSPLATAISAQVTATLDDSLPLEFMFGEHAERARLIEPSERIHRGRWHPPPDDVTTLTVRRSVLHEGELRSQ